MGGIYPSQSVSPKETYIVPNRPWGEVLILELRCCSKGEDEGEGYETHLTDKAQIHRAPISNSFQGTYRYTRCSSMGPGSNKTTLHERGHARGLTTKRQTSVQGTLWDTKYQCHHEDAQKNAGISPHPSDRTFGRNIEAPITIIPPTRYHSKSSLKPAGSAKCIYQHMCSLGNKSHSS